MTKLIISRSVRWTTSVDMSSYPGMTPEQAVLYEEALPLEEVAEQLEGNDEVEMTTEVRISE